MKYKIKVKNIIFILISTLIVYLIYSYFFNKAKFIYIYNDEGVSEESLLHTTTTIKDIINPSINIKTINAQEIENGNWAQDAILLIMPGGADIPYTQKLNGKGNLIIQNYVKKGGAYLGICAGSYYASSYIEFDKGGSLEVLGDRELQFFKGTTVGPVLAPYDYKSQKGSRAAKITTQIFSSFTLNVFYNGGGYFRDALNYPKTYVLAHYQNNLPAIIHIQYHEGNVILSGVHFEYNPDLLNKNDPYLSKIIPDLLNSEKERLLLITQIFKKLGINASCLKK